MTLTTMKAAITPAYGPPSVLTIKEAALPVPGNNDVMIKVMASSVTAGDCNIRGFTFIPSGFGPLPRLMFGWHRPKQPIQGCNLAGVIVKVGKNVNLFKVGDEVFGINSIKQGAYAEYVCWPEKSVLALKPANISFEDAAALPYGAHTALYFLRDRARIQPGQKVLVKGASGGVGMYAVQIARHLGAEVTGVCSPGSIDFVMSLGAAKVIDYSRDDFTKNGQTYDVIFDTVMGNVSFKKVRKSLNPVGLYLTVAGGIPEMFQSLRTAIAGGRKVVFGTPPANPNDMVTIKEMVENGSIKPYIDTSYPLESIVDAHRHAERGGRKGAVVVKI